MNETLNFKKHIQADSIMERSPQLKYYVVFCFLNYK